MSFDASDNEIEIELRSPRDVAMRAIVLASTLRRLALEEAPEPEGDVRSEVFDLREWLREEHLALAMTPEETVMIETPVGKIDTDRRAESAWQGEALAVLVWALGQGALAPPGELPDLPAVLAAIPAPWERTASFVSSATLRSESEIAAARERGELWHWRSTVESLRREATASELREYDDLIREVALESFAAEVLPRTQSGDFEVKREAVKSLSTAALAALIASSAERLLALNWICGFGNSWDSVPLDV